VDPNTQIPTVASILIAALVVAVLVGLVVMALRRRRERRRIEQIIGRSYRPQGSRAGGPSDDLDAAAARKRAADLGRSRRSWS
jgi:hypothetical protein